MKVKYWIFSVIALFLVIGLMIFGKNVFLDNTLYIAVAGPMEKNNGKAMVQGIQLYLDKVNREGGIDGKKVKLLQFDDNNQFSLAEKQALTIINSKALAVIGHYTSDASLAAAPLYQKHGIPVITGSATANKITEYNDWYFRVIFTNRDQGALLANYARKILGFKQAYILFDEDSYGTTLAEAFIKTAKRIRLTIKHQWSFNTNDSASLKSTLNQMIETLKKDESGILFLATHSAEAVETITKLRRLEHKIPIMGADSLASSHFMQTFKNKYPQEKAYPGYYTDGIYIASPFLIDIAGKRAQDFQHEFLSKKYLKESMITAALHYDATMVAIDAIKQALAQSEATSLKEQRQQVKENLWQLSKLENAIEGVTGDLYFGKNGDAIKSVPIGVYKKGKPIVTWYQYEPLNNLHYVDNLLQKVLDNEIIQVNDKFMHKAQVVYVGIDFNDLRELDTKLSTYTANFYLWFRFKEDEKPVETEVPLLSQDSEYNQLMAYLGAVLQTQKEEHQDKINDIIFTNIFDPNKNDLKKYRSDKRISFVAGERVITKTYRIKTRFKSDFDFHDYPLDKQVLNLQFRHSDLTRDKLIYVVDVLGMKDMGNWSKQTGADTLDKNQFFSIPGWHMNKLSFFQNSQKNDSTLGIPELFNTQQRVEYSQFNVNVEIERQVLSFVLKNLLPTLFVIALGYVVYFTKTFTLQMSLNINMILATSLFHLKLASALVAIEYNVLIEYVFYTVYLMAVLGIIAALIIYHHDDRQKKAQEKVDKIKDSEQTEKRAEELKKLEKTISEDKHFIKRIHWIGRIGYPLIILSALLIISHHKWLPYLNF